MLHEAPKTLGCSFLRSICEYEVGYKIANPHGRPDTQLNKGTKKQFYPFPLLTPSPLTLHCSYKVDLYLGLSVCAQFLARYLMLTFFSHTCPKGILRVNAVGWDMKLRHSLRFRRPGSSRSELAGMSSLLPKCTDFEQLALWSFGHPFTHITSWENPGNEVVTLTFTVTSAAETSSFALDSISSVGR